MLALPFGQRPGTGRYKSNIVVIERNRDAH